MSAVLPANSTYAAIETKVRRLTVSASESSLSSADIQRAVNTFYNSDFPYAIKLDQMRAVYKFLTIPNVDRYPVDPNLQQGFRDPVYIGGVRGNLFKDRTQLFSLFPRFPTLFLPASGDGITQTFSFNLYSGSNNPYPSSNFGILSTQVVIGGIDANGNPIRIIDDGGAVTTSYGIGSNTTQGQLLYLQQDTVGQNVYLDGTLRPAIPPLSPLPSPSPPIAPTAQYVGTVNYVTTQISVTFPVAPAAGTQISVWAPIYTPGRPYNMLFWNNEITLRPVPEKTYLVEVEVYQTPSQFLLTTDNPALNQWAEYIAYGAAREILRERQDFDGVDSLKEGFDRQEALVLERQSVEEIGKANITMFNSTSYGYGYGWGLGGGLGY